ncbi:MAG: hypothetical protein ABSH49_15255 [Bryobacteraceae bacterium]
MTSLLPPHCAIRNDTGVVGCYTPEPAKPERRITEEGMKRIIAATKKRWAAVRAAKAATA